MRGVKFTQDRNGDNIAVLDGKKYKLMSDIPDTNGEFSIEYFNYKGLTYVHTTNG